MPVQSLIRDAKWITSLKINGLRAAIVQFEAVHEEVIPSIVRALSAGGVAAHAYVNSRAQERRGDLLNTVTETSGRVSYPRIERAADWSTLAQVVAGSGADFVVLNTFQRNSVANWARQVGLPVVGIVHNPKLFLEQDECLRLVRDGMAEILTLAPHVSAWLAAHGPSAYADIGYVSHTFWDLPSVRSLAGTRRVVIPGSVNYSSRDYLSVLDAMPDIVRAAGSTLIEIVIVGGGPDRDNFQKAVGASRYACNFRFAECNEASGFVDNETYFSHLTEADFILPMLPEARTDYRTFKITSAIPTSVGFCIPAIVDRWTASIYGLPCVTYEAGELLNGLTAGVALRNEQLDQLRRDLTGFKARQKVKSADTMSQVVATLLYGRASGATHH